MQCRNIRKGYTGPFLQESHSPNVFVSERLIVKLHKNDKEFLFENLKILLDFCIGYGILVLIKNTAVAVRNGE